MITEDRLTKALHFLATTDESAADLKVEVERKNYILETVSKRMFLEADGNIEVRKAKAAVSDEVLSAQNDMLEAMTEWERLKAKRMTEALIVDVFRTLEASRRQGRV